MIDALSKKFGYACGLVNGVAASLADEHRDSQATALYEAVSTFQACLEALELCENEEEGGL